MDMKMMNLNIKNNSKLFFWSAFIVIGAMVGCAGRRVIENFQGSNSTTENKITVRAGWVKDKNDAFDAEIWMQNDREAAVIFTTGSIQCYRNGVIGAPRVLSNNNGLVSLEAHQNFRLVLVCNFPGKQAPTKGAARYKIVFNNIAERTENFTLGKTVNKAMTLNLVE